MLLLIPMPGCSAGTRAERLNSACMIARQVLSSIEARQDDNHLPPHPDNGLASTCVHLQIVRAINPICKQSTDDTMGEHDEQD